VVNRIALDTNAAIAFINGSLDLAKALSEYDDLVVPLPVVGELYFGAVNSSLAEKNLLEVNKFLKRVSVSFPDEETCMEYANTRFELRKKGKPIPENDIWIASVSRYHKLPIMTNDGHFKHVRGLKVVNF